MFTGITLLSEEQYRELQQLGNFDTSTSSWVKTPAGMRKLGGGFSVTSVTALSFFTTTKRNNTMPPGDSGFR